MATTLLPASAIGQYPRPSAVPIVAGALGCTPATARQFLNPSDPRNPWIRAALATAALYRAGLTELAEQRCQVVDEARALVPETVTREQLENALLDEQEADGLEDVAQVALITGLTPAALDTWIRRAERHQAKVGAALRIARAFQRQGAAR